MLSVPLPCGQHMVNIQKGTGRCPTVDLVTEHLAWAELLITEQQWAVSSAAAVAFSLSGSLLVCLLPAILTSCARPSCFFLYSQLLWRAYDRGKRWGTNSTAPIFNRHIMIVAQRGNFVLLNILECKKCHVSNSSTIQKNIFSFPRCFSFFPHLQKIWITRSITG